MLQWLITQKTEDRIELITRAMLETMVEETTYLAVYFCKSPSIRTPLDTSQVAVGSFSVLPFRFTFLYIFSCGRKQTLKDNYENISPFLSHSRASPPTTQSITKHHQHRPHLISVTESEASTCLLSYLVFC